MSEVKDGTNNEEIKQEKDQNYWRSFAELHKDPALIASSHNEFQEGATDDFDPSKLSRVSRRKFLALVGASAALAGVGCSDYRDKGEIIPYTKMPEDTVVGKPKYYASTFNYGSISQGIIIKTREGRPIKVDGNPDHPVSKGKINAIGQASVLNLYDPDRLQNPMKKARSGEFLKTTWQQADSEIVNALTANAGKEIAIISSKILSPTTKKTLDDFAAKYPGTKVYSYELFNDEVRSSAWKKCYGTDYYPLIKWNEAKVIVVLEADFLGVDGNKVENSRMFTEGREVSDAKNFNRLYVVEGNMSQTGMNADYRLKLRPDAQNEFVLSLLKEVARRTAYELPIDLSNFSLNNFAKTYSLNTKKLKYLVDDLVNNKGNAIVYAGRILSENTHIAVNLLNDILGNTKLFRTDSDVYSAQPLSSKEELESLVSDMNSGKVGTVIHFDSDPVYHLPNDLGYADALKKVPTVISLIESANDSSAAGHFTLPINHPFESWGDAKTRTGFSSLQQPVIAAIYNTREKEAVLLNWIGGANSKFSDTMYHEYLMKNWESNVYPSLKSRLPFKEFWYGALQEGIVLTNDSAKTFGKFNNSALNGINKTNSKLSGYAVVLNESYSLGDGKYLNNGWLQELPHPVSKMTWDNYASVSQNTAKTLGVESNDKISVTIGKRTLEIPVLVQPGCADNTIAIETGWGRTVVGEVGKGTGFNANVLLSKDAKGSAWLFTSANIKKGDGSYKLVSAQEHHLFEHSPNDNTLGERHIIKEGTVKEYLKNPKFIAEMSEEAPVDEIYPKHPGYFTGVKWAMSIDLNKCTGCSDCVVACIAENNNPVVGKDQVAVGREMQWLRIDTYYSGSEDDPIVSTQPMLCQQCDNAPCENVCPVAATTHSKDGLNQMVYNRCVGTRYCSNNCPYKVRRFNFFNFRDHFRDGFQQKELLDLVYNPEVTVRSRGVMEKCTFCIQRIATEREDAIREHRNIIGANVHTACQDACNTNAINFGDMNDKNSEFYKYRNHELGYYVLEQLNVKPNVTYLAKLRNTHSEEV
jgi:molybdopterin-containing oxidoreductase family iron-sulfur binding subunit